MAKEYCACSEEGVLILSEFAGAAAQLGRGALLVNPYDTEGVAEAIYRAYCMTADERRARMCRLQRSIRKYDVFWWADAFLRAAFAKNVSALPLPEDLVWEPSLDYVPIWEQPSNLPLISRPHKTSTLVYTRRPPYH